MTMPAHLIEKRNRLADRAASLTLKDKEAVRHYTKYGFDWGYEFAMDEQKKLLDEVDEFLIGMDRYLNWNSDDLVGDDLIGDKKRTKTFNAKLEMLTQLQATLKAHRGTNELP